MDSTARCTSQTHIQYFTVLVSLSLFYCILSVFDSVCYSAETHKMSASSTYTPRYVLITRAVLSDAFTPLVERRAQQGFEVALVTVEQISQDYSGRDIQEQIRECIRAYYDPNIQLFVALGGDANSNASDGGVVPARYCLPRSGEWVPADLYYADMDPGTWDQNNNEVYGEPGDITLAGFTPEVFVGRIAVRNEEQASAYIRKIELYEEASLEGFSNSMIIVSGTKSGVDYLTGQARPSNFVDHDPVSTRERDYTWHYLSDIQPHWQAVPLHLFFDTKSFWDQERCGDYALSSEHLKTQLNEANQGRGYHFIRHIGHGNCFVMGLGREQGVGFNASFINQLRNEVPGIVISSSCGVARYDSKCEPCCAEAFIHNPHGGAIAFFGPSRSSGNNIAKDYLITQLFQEESLFLGEAFARAECQAAAQKGEQYIKDPYHPCIYTFLGDPAILRLDIEPDRKVQIFQPMGCEVVDTRADLVIRWNATGTGFRPDDKVALDYSDDSGRTWYPIPGAEELPYHGRSFVWATCPLPPGQHYRIRVTALSDPAVSHTPDRDFTVAHVGILTVRTDPYISVKMGGRYYGQTPYTWSIKSGDQIGIKAPVNSGDWVFAGWENGQGMLLSTSPEIDIECYGTTTLWACYDYPEIRHYYVNDSVAEDGIPPGNDLNDGLSPQTPKLTLTALFEAYPEMGRGDVVHISAGTYQENLWLGQVNSGLSLCGVGPDQTILDGGGSRCIGFDNCYNFTLRDLTLCGGGADLGACIWSNNSSGTIRHCVFRDNVSSNRGGVLKCHESRLRLIDCDFVNNVARQGGVLALRKKNDLRFTNCRFTGNQATDAGGVSYIRNNNDVAFTHCLMSGNKAGSHGSVIYIRGGCYVGLTNCTWAENTAKKKAALTCIKAEDNPSTIHFKNCILWNGTDQISPANQTVLMTYSNVQGGWPGWGNMNVAPGFARMGSWSDGVWIDGDYHLVSSLGRWDTITGDWVFDDITSPCIDCGSEDSDYGSEMEPNGGRVNMGVYGGTAEASMSTDLIE